MAISLYNETVSTNTDLLGEDIGTQMTCTVDDAQTQTVRQVCDEGIQLSLHFDHKETQTTCYVQHRETITDDSEADARPFRLEQIKDDDQAVKFYTGFPTFLHLMTCFNFLGPAAFNLCYSATKKDIPSTGGRNHCLSSLSSLNEFFDLMQAKVGIKRARLELPLSDKPTYSIKEYKHLD